MAAVVVKGGSFLLPCKTRSFHSGGTGTFTWKGKLLGSLPLRRRAAPVLLFPSPSRRSFFRSSLGAAAADTDLSADVPLSKAGSTVPSMAVPEANSGVDVPSSSSEAIKSAANALDIRVGRILRAWRHPEADSLYVEEVDIGETEPRTICSGLVNSIPLDHIQNIKVVVLANLKPRNMRGVKSSGMLMAASDASHDNVELLLPPESSVPGERIWFGSEEERENQLAAATPNQVQKKKIWELVQPHLKTDFSCIASLGMYPMRTSAGFVVSRSLKNANIS